MSLRLVPFEPFHMDFVDYREHDRQVLQMFDEPTARALAYANNGLAFTGFDDGKPVGYGGIIKMWPGVGEIWIMSSDFFDCKPVATARLLHNCFNALTKGLKLHRVQASVLSTHDTGKRLAEWVGMEQESTLKQFGPDKEDYIRYVKLGVA